MWDRGNLLFVATVFTALFYRVAAVETKQLDMAPDAVHYSYDGCREKAMEKLIRSSILQKELNSNKGFSQSWNANVPCLEQKKGQEKDVAALAYANADEEFVTTFDNAVETKGGNISTYENQFHFKSLHFLLMDNMAPQEPGHCKTVYVRTDKKHMAKVGSKVRLGRFRKAQLDFRVLEKETDLEGECVLNITTCFFVQLAGNVCQIKSDNAVLLSPAEVFTVESVQSKTVADATFTEIVLKHSTVKSVDNCSFLSRSPAAISTQWLVLVLVASSLFAL